MSRLITPNILLWSLQGLWQPLTPLSVHATVGADAVWRTTGDRAIGLSPNGQDTVAGVDEQHLTQYTVDLGGTWSAAIAPALASRTSFGLQYLAANASDSALSTDGSSGSVALENSTLHLADLTQSAYVNEALSIVDKVAVGGSVRWDHHRLQSGHVSSTVADPSATVSWAVLGTTF